jgi:excisionase family DNA binding protein
VNERLMTLAEVAEYFRVDARTVERWVAAGELTLADTPGRIRRFRESDIKGTTAPATGEATV